MRVISDLEAGLIRVTRVSNIRAGCPIFGMHVSKMFANLGIDTSAHLVGLSSGLADGAKEMLVVPVCHFDGSFHVTLRESAQ